MTARSTAPRPRARRLIRALPPAVLATALAAVVAAPAAAAATWLPVAPIVVAEQSSQSYTHNRPWREALAVSPAGAAVVLFDQTTYVAVPGGGWQASARVAVATRAPSGAWSAVQAVGAVGSNAIPGTGAVNDAGDAIAAWRGTVAGADRVHAFVARRVAGSWRPALDLGPGVVAGVDVNTEGRVVVVTNSPRGVLRLRMGDPGAATLGRAHGIGAYLPGSRGSVDVSLDGGGVVHLLAQLRLTRRDKTTSIVEVTRSPAGTYAGPVTIATGADVVGSVFGQDEGGNAVATWLTPRTGPAGPFGFAAAARVAGQSWTGPVQVSTTATGQPETTVALQPWRPGAIVAWRDTDGLRYAELVVGAPSTITSVFTALVAGQIWSPAIAAGSAPGSPATLVYRESGHVKGRFWTPQAPATAQGVWSLVHDFGQQLDAINLNADADANGDTVALWGARASASQWATASSRAASTAEDSRRRPA